VVHRRDRLLLGRPAALAALGTVAEGLTRIPLPEDRSPHPVVDWQQARRAIDQARGRVELDAGRKYRETSGAWLVVDGALSESPQWVADPHAIGVIKSHATLPFDGPELERYLRLPPGCRTTIFAPAGREIAPVYSWALRLWPWEGKDLFHGFIRVEAAATTETLASADEISRWLLAERAPISTPDPRWDRLLYGIHEVEAFLKARRER
jgi:hypothetical protein